MTQPPSERILRQIERLLDQADEAMSTRDWAAAMEIARAVLSMDPENRDAQTYLAAAHQAVGEGHDSASEPKIQTPSPLPLGEAGRRAAPSPRTGEGEPSLPTSFVNGRYVVERFLGEGGKKRVYLAHDTQLDRDVAFALLKNEGLDLDGLIRIRREAQAMGRLGDHPHIVTVFDIGDENGQPYIVSQYMAGGSLQSLIDQAPDHHLPLDQTLQIADQICQALEHAHAHAVIHRDLKPGNVFLSSSPSPVLGASPRRPASPARGRGAGQTPSPLAGEGGGQPPPPSRGRVGERGRHLSLPNSATSGWQSRWIARALPRPA